MPSVNMIAPRRAEMKRLERGMRKLLIVILAEVVVVLAVAAIFSAKVMSTRGRTAELDVELAKLRPTVRKIEFYEQASTRLQPKVELLGDAKDHTLRWYHMLQTLSVTMPGNTWLTRISASPPPAGSEVTAMPVNLNGVSADQNLIGETMLRLNSYPGFNSVDLHFTQKTLVGKRQAIEFEVGAGLKLSDKAREKGAVKPDAQSTNN